MMLILITKTLNSDNQGFEKKIEDANKKEI